MSVHVLHRNRAVLLGWSVLFVPWCYDSQTCFAMFYDQNVCSTLTWSSVLFAVPYMQSSYLPSPILIPYH